MSIMLKEFFSEAYDIVYTFANTGAEHEDTLRFLNEVDKRYNLGVVWIEAVVHHGAKKSCTHRVVTYETASRDSEPFEEMVRKYGLPNQTFKNCTRELKLRPMQSYLRSIGWTEWVSAIGIRADEMRRVSPTQDAQNIVYPLVHWSPKDKQDILDFFEPFDWNLAIEEWEGNCVWCYKKSERKLFKVWQKDPRNFDTPIRLDQLYKNVGPNNVPGPRQMYRGRRSAPVLVQQFQEYGEDAARGVTDGGCSESCEVYETEEIPE